MTGAIFRPHHNSNPINTNINRNPKANPAGDSLGWKISSTMPLGYFTACNYIELFGSSTRDRHVQRIYRQTFENNIKYVVHDDLGRKNRTTLYILPCHWLYECISQFHSCGTYSVLSQSPSIVTSYATNCSLYTILFRAYTASCDYFDDL